MQIAGQPQLRSKISLEGRISRNGWKATLKVHPSRRPGFESPASVPPALRQSPKVFSAEGDHF
jgi:hypothetical protein